MMLDARGTANSKTDYEFQDMYPAEGNNYYRLIAIDKDGKNKIAGTKLVVYNLTGSLSLSINPNPATNNEIKGVIESGKQQQLRIRLFDIGGAEVYNRNTLIKTGKNNIKINIKSGTYILHLESQDGRRIKEKVIVQ